MTGLQEVKGWQQLIEKSHYHKVEQEQIKTVDVEAQ
jgi:hypothetical protein